MNFINKLPKWIRLPTVVELGKSKSNALPMESFGANPGDYTWEKFHKEMKQTYPIKFFIFHTMSRWFSYQWGKVDRLLYKIKCHTLKKYRYHLLDLRQPKETDEFDTYRFGWIDSDNQMLLALFNILINFCEKEQNISEYINLLKKENNKDGFCWDEQIKAYEEIQSIYTYWKTDRKVERSNVDKLLDECYGRGKSMHDPALEFKKTELTRLEEQFDTKEDEMLHRLINVRKYMWT